MIADITVPLEKDSAEKLLGMIDSLEDLDDVQNVYTNADISDDIMEQLS
jgi:transcriptional/translational regulatory protein YebC/TACO1